MDSSAANSAIGAARMGGSLHIGTRHARKMPQQRRMAQVTPARADRRVFMTENEQLEPTEVVQAEEAEPQGEAPEVDWKAESRKWEKLAKRNKDAAAELEALKQSQLTEQEKMQARAEKAEAELSRLTAERDRMAAAREVSEESGVPSELLSFCKDRDAMEEFAEIFSRHAHTPSAPKTQASRIVRDTNTPVSNRDTFAEMAANAFR